LPQLTSPPPNVRKRPPLKTPLKPTSRDRRGATRVRLVDRNLLSAGLLAEKLHADGFEALPVASLEAALQANTNPAAVVVWTFSWPHDEPELAGLERFTGKLPVLVLGTGCPIGVQSRLLLLGARGYVDQREGLPALLQAIRRVVSGNRRFEIDAFAASYDSVRRHNSSRPAGQARLTPREEAIIARVALGDCNKDIARRLQITESTVKSHVQNIFSKLGVSSRLALALLYLQQQAAAERDGGR